MDLKSFCRTIVMVTVVLTASVTGMFVSAGEAIAEQIYVTEGDVGSDGIHVNDNLGVGRTWAVYDLDDREYLGNASVSRNEMREVLQCTFSSSRNGNDFQSILNPSLGNSGSALLVRPVPASPNLVEFRDINFEQLPESLRSTIRDSVAGRILPGHSAMTIDIDGDDLADIVRIQPDFLGGTEERTYAKVNDHWVEKYFRICESPC